MTISTENIEKALQHLKDICIYNRKEMEEFWLNPTDEKIKVHAITCKALVELSNIKQHKEVCGWSIEDIYTQAESLEIEISSSEAKQILTKFSKRFDRSDGLTLICNLLEDLQEAREA